MIAEAAKRKGTKKISWNAEEVIEEEPKMVAKNGCKEESDIIREAPRQIRRCAMFKNLSRNFRNFSGNVGSPERHMPIIDQLQCIHRVLEYPMIQYFTNIILRIYWKFAAVVPCLDKMVQLMFSIGGVIIVFASPFGLSLWDAIMCRILDVIEAIFPDIRATVYKRRSIITEINCCELACCHKVDHDSFCCNHSDATTGKKKVIAADGLHPECICHKQPKQAFRLQNSVAEELGVDNH